LSAFFLTSHHVAIVSNTSPLILYARIGRLELLQQLFDDVLVPPAVYQEVVLQGAGRPGAASVSNAVWIQRQALSDYRVVQALMVELDRGEAEAITLAMELGGQTAILLDDQKGRRLADARGVEVIGSGGVLVRAKRRGLLPSVRPVLDELRAAGLRLSETAYREILAPAGEAPDESRRSDPH
jgi:uncharacterized protein